MNRFQFSATSRLPHADGGFTLLEVLIALVILAVALAAASRAMHIATDSTLVMKQRLIAGWAAENRLAERRAITAEAWPEPGVSEGQITQAGIAFAWQETVSATPNAAFRRVEVKIFSAADKNYALATLVGYLADSRGQ